MKTLTHSDIDGKCPRFITQRDKYSCGPVAVINYWKWVGLPARIQDLRFVKRILKSKIQSGTANDKIAKMVGGYWEPVAWTKFYNYLKAHNSALITHKKHCWFVPCLLNKERVLHINYNAMTYTSLTIKETQKIIKTAQVILL